MELNELQIKNLDFDRGKGMLVAVVQHIMTKDVLMVAYQDQEAVNRTKTSGEMWFYSRSRRALWHKGETSGNNLVVQDVFWDCDRDALLYRVLPGGPACHTGQRSCFGDLNFSLGRLQEIILDRKNNPKRGSYTNKLLADPDCILNKIKEESDEVVEAAGERDNRAHLTWEIADLIYHVLVCIVKNGLEIRDIEKELARRSNKVAFD